MSSLYNITASIREVLDNGYLVDSETGEVQDNTEELLRELQIARAEKIENIGLYIKNLEADVAAMKAEEKALSDRRKSKENKISRLKEMLSNNLNSHGEKKFETARIAMSFRMSKKLEVTDETKIPNEYIDVIETTKIKAAELKKAISNGASIEGACIKECQNIQIK